AVRGARRHHGLACGPAPPGRSTDDPSLAVCRRPVGRAAHALRRNGSVSPAPLASGRLGPTPTSPGPDLDRPPPRRPGPRWQRLPALDPRPKPAPAPARGGGGAAG